MVEAILKDKKKILPCAAYLDGQYGVKGLYVGVPVKLGRGGVEQIIEITLTPEEQAAFDKSAASVRELVDKLKLKRRRTGAARPGPRRRSPRALPSLTLSAQGVKLASFHAPPAPAWVGRRPFV